MALNFPSNPNTNDTYSYNNRTWVFTGSAWKQLRSDASDITTTGNITANVVTANSFIGDGSQLTGLPAGYTDSNVASYLPTYTGNIAAGNISVTGTIDGYATTSYVDSEVANLVASAPSTLDTLNELATALGNDPNLSATLTSLIGNNSANITTLQGNITTLESDITNLEANIPANLQSNVTTLEGNIVSIESDITTLEGNITSIETGITNLEANIPANLQSNVTTLESSVITLQGNIVTLDNQVANLNYYDDTNVTTFLSDIGSNSIATTGNITADYFIGNGSQLIGLPAAYTDSNVESLLSGNITIGNISVTGKIDGYATTSYVDSEVANLVASAPSTLDTLNELATALGNDPNLSTTLTSLIGNNSANITTLQGNITSIETDIFNLEANIPANLQSNVTTLESNVTILQGNIVALEGNITALDNQVANLNYYDDTNVTTFLSDIGSNAITTTGDITANSFIGDGSQLTGLPESYTDSNVATFLSNIGNNSILTTGNITAGYFIGDGSELTGLNASANLTLSNTAPTSPTHGDLWVDSTNGKKLYYIDDGDSQQWVELDLTTSISIGSQESANIDLSAVDQNIVPSANITYDLGSETNRWRDIYLANSTIYLGEANISAQGGALTLPSTVSIGNATLDASSGNLALPSTVSIGSVTLDASTGNLALPANSSIGGASVSTPRIASIDYGDDDTAANVAGGQTIGIVGSGFSAGAQVLLDGSSIGVVTVVNSGRIEITAPAKSTGSYTLYVINSDGATGIYIPGVQYSGVPSWSSPSAGSLGSIYETETVSNTFVANSDSTVSYSLYSGNLPEGTTLDSNTGVLTGNANLIVGSSVTYNFTIRATDEENQDTDRAFSLTVNADEVTWSSPTDGATVSIIVDQVSETTLNASSAVGDSIIYTANTLPNGLSLSGNTISGTANIEGNTSVAITATADTTTRSATITVTFAVILPLSDDYWNQTVLLINGGIAPPTTTVISDASANALDLIVFDQVGASRNSPHNPNWSNWFDGTGDNLLLSYNSAFHLSDDFTIECWFYANAYGGMILNFAGGLNIAWASYEIVNNSDGINFAASSANSGYDIGSETGATGRMGTIQLGTWNHIAVTRSGNVYRGFVNGVEGYTQTLALTPYDPNARGLAIGSNYSTTWGTGTPTSSVNGYISNLRIVKGTAVYTSNFTPSTLPLTAITNTSLLTCQGNRFIDNSANAFALTRNGNVRVSRFSPFADPTNSYGSGAFDGVNDYLSLPAASATPVWLGTDDFTIEGWFLRKTISARTEQLWQFQNGPSLLWYDNNNIYYQVVPGESTVWTTVTWTTAGAIDGGWHHYAMTRQSGTVRVYVDGRFLMSSTTNANVTSGYLYIGFGSYGYWKGNIADFRIVKGTALYTGGATKGDVVFTPPTTQLTAVSGTALLTLQSNVDLQNNSRPDDTSKLKHDFWPSGDPYMGAHNPASSSGWSGYFDGTGAYLSIPDNALLEIGASSFCIEAWINLDALPANNTYQAILGKWNNGAYSYLFQIGNVSGTYGLFLSYTINGSTGLAVSRNVTITAGSWNHVAVTRDSTTVRFFLNGVELGDPQTVNATFYDGIAGVNIGRHGDSLNYFKGYISNCRLVIGSAVYTSTFTPSTAPLEPIANTILLTLRGINFTDDSSNRFAITRNGYAKTAPFSPFKPHTVAPDSYSVYFDGTGDFLQINSAALPGAVIGTGDYTLEFWAYASGALSSFKDFVSINAGGTKMFGTSNGTLVAYSQPLGNINNGTFPVGQWNHVVFCRSSGTSRCFLNGQFLESAADTLDWGTTGAIWVASWTNGGENWPGYISNMRFSSTARFTTNDNFTPPTTPYIADEHTLFLVCQSPTVIDNSDNAWTITASGNSQPTRFNPFGETVTTDISYDPDLHGSSVYFNYNSPAGDQFIVAYDPAFNFNTGDFTIEFWMYYKDEWPAGNYSSGSLVRRNGTGAGDWGLYLESTTTTNTAIRFKSAATNVIDVDYLQYINNWTHVAVSRSGTNLRLFLNGVLVSTVTNSDNFASVTDLLIGNGSWAWIGGLKITNGRAVYTAAFVPTTGSPSAESDTALIMHTDGMSVIDATGRNSVQMRGDAKVNTAVTKFNSGSIQLIDATEPGASRLNIPAEEHLNFPGAFTFEAWIYPTDLSQSFHSILGKYGNWYWGVYGGANSGLVRMLGGGGSNVASSAAGAVVVNQWQHLAITRDNNNVTRIFVNGVQSGSNGSSTENFSNTRDLSVGSYAGDQDSYDWRGYLDDIRMTRGLARYTANFTPPTGPLPVK